MDPRLHALLDIYLSGQLTEDQRRELAGLLEDEAAAVAFADLVQEQLSRGTFSVDADLRRTEERIVRGVLEKIRPARVRRVVGMRRWGWAAAAILLIGLGVYLETVRRHAGPVAAGRSAGVKDVAPGSDRAILTLSDGTLINLDSAAGGTIARQGNTVIIQQAGGQLVYRGGSAAGGGSMMNTVRTPRGGQYRLVLPDGTQVWLNAASSITYPAAFARRERRVQVSGEAYFEVVKSIERPFVVDVEGGARVEVLGTAFDVNAYTNEERVKTTLLEGSVKVGRVVLRAGQQAQLGPQGLSVMNNVNMDRVMAWKNGLFNFDDAGLREVMRQLARWYDIEVVYEKDIPDIRFEGEISRNISLSNLLKVLARAEVKFRLEEGRRLVVLP